MTLTSLAWPSAVSWNRVAMATAAVAVAAVTYRVARGWYYTRRLERKRRTKREACQRAVQVLETRVNRKLHQRQRTHQHKPDDSGDDNSKTILDQNEIDRITSLPLTQLLAELRQRHLTANDVLTSFQFKALSAHQRTNCLVEPVVEADTWASELDSQMSSSTGPLHGLPVSIKEYFGIKGYDGCIGLYSLIGHPSEEDSVLVKVLKAQGAIPFVKTNLPHMAFSYTTWNPVFGNTKNPHDPTRGPGGSSGGEAALIALNGSPLGFGSDIGGSIRNPCHFCGLAGLKPTGNRISTKGTFTIDATNNCLPIVLGPMARDVDSLVVAMKAILVPIMFQLDRSVPPIPFRDDIYTDKRPLRIGYYTNNGLFEPVEACQRAVQIAIEVLSSDNKHEIIPWQLSPEIANAASALAIRGKLLFADKGETMMEVLEGDKAFGNIAEFEQVATMPMPLRRVFARLLRLVDSEMADYVHYACGVESVAKWWKLIEEVQTLRYSFDGAWEDARLDVLICPAFSCPAMPDTQLLPHRGEGSDCQVYNVLDVPAGVVPVTKVTDEDISKMATYPSLNEAYTDIKKGMEGAQGLPIGVQVVAPRYQEELCLRVMKEIEIGVVSRSSV